MSERLNTTIEQIDAINRQDPNTEMFNGKEFPKEFLYSLRMTEVLKEYDSNAGELLVIAARGQHIKRWDIPRTNYPKGKAGYHKWRKELANLHVELIGGIMSNNGYSEEEVSAIDAMIHKKDLNANSDSQTLQDVVSIVFLKYYAEDFIKKHSDKKVGDIMAKMLRKVSPQGIQFAIKSSPKIISDAVSNMK